MAGFATPNESPQSLEARLQLGSALKKGDLQAVLHLLDGGEIPLDQERYDGCLCATADSAHPRSAGWPSNGAYSYQGYVDSIERIETDLTQIDAPHPGQWSPRGARLGSAPSHESSTPQALRNHGTKVRHRSARRAPVPAHRAPGAAHRLVPNLAPG